MTTSSNKKYEHFDEPVESSEPAISGVGKDSQKSLAGRFTKWIRLSRLPNESDRNYAARLEKDSQMMSKYRSHLLVADSHDSSGSRLVAVASKTPVIGYSWMPVLPEIGNAPISFEHAKAIAIWLNSTLGRVALRNVTARKISYPKFRPVSFDAIPFPNIDEPCVVTPLSNVFDETSKEVVPQFRDGRVPIREHWDDAVALALEIDRVLIAECADKLACDPFVSKDHFFE
ncbi:MAG: hypothetical protein OXI60_06655 [Acidiferrobacterales bacterium]|nr:hypothetical protein [Acidiferrobacterales bacterium]